MIATVLLALVVWFAVSIPVGMLIGFVIAGRPIGEPPAEPVMQADMLQLDHRAGK